MNDTDSTFEARSGRSHKPRRILAIVSNTAELHGMPVGFLWRGTHPCVPRIH